MLLLSETKRINPEKPPGPARGLRRELAGEAGSDGLFQALKPSASQHSMLDFNLTSVGPFPVTCSEGSQWIQHQTQMYHLLGGWLCEPAHGRHGDEGDGGQNHGEVEVVDVLHHRGTLVGLVTLRLSVNEVQDQPNQA